tara:strand:- start:5668 stop:6456 length:789 start_codon:yes stop_codon:yes gene_type:complete
MSRDNETEDYINAIRKTKLDQTATNTKTSLVQARDRGTQTAKDMERIMSEVKYTDDYTKAQEEKERAKDLTESVKINNANWVSGIRNESDNFVGGDYDVADRSGPTPSTSQFVDQIISSISQVESSGGKNLNHKKVKTGMYKDQTAIGEWAIMPGNIDPTMNNDGSRNRKDSWTNFSKFQQLYPEITPDAKGIKLLKKNPAAQKLIVTNQVSKNLNKTGDHREVASIWFTGKKIKNAGKVKDDTGTTNLTYLQKFDNAMENL